MDYNYCEKFSDIKFRNGHGFDALAYAKPIGFSQFGNNREEIRELKLIHSHDEYYKRIGAFGAESLIHKDKILCAIWKI